jgi:hypothetical protein
MAETFHDFAVGNQKFFSALCGNQPDLVSSSLKSNFRRQ